MVGTGLINSLSSTLSSFTQRMDIVFESSEEISRVYEDKLLVENPNKIKAIVGSIQFEQTRHFIVKTSGDLKTTIMYNNGGLEFQDTCQEIINEDDINVEIQFTRHILIEFIKSVLKGRIENARSDTRHLIRQLTISNVENFHK